MSGVARSLGESSQCDGTRRAALGDSAASAGSSEWGPRVKKSQRRDFDYALFPSRTFFLLI